MRINLKHLSTENYEQPINISEIEIGKRTCPPLHSQAQYSGDNPSSLPPFSLLYLAHLMCAKSSHYGYFSRGQMKLYRTEQGSIVEEPGPVLSLCLQ